MALLSRVAFSLVCILGLAGCRDGVDVSVLAQSKAVGQFERTLEVTGAVDLDVRTGSGDVAIRVGPDNRVRILGRIAARERAFEEPAVDRVRRVEAAPPIRQAGNMIQIGDTEDDPRYDNMSISYELVVPPNTRVASHTGSGDQFIGNVNGDVTARAGSGDIEIERAGGGLDAQAGSGDVRARAVAGAVRVRVGSGSVDVAQTAPGEVDVRAGSGDVFVALPRDAAATLSLHTGSGSIDSPLPVQADVERRRNRLEGTIRGGGTRVDIRTGSGSIRVQ